METHDKNNETKKAAEQLTSEIKEKEKQLENLQNDCRHPNEEVSIKDVTAGSGRCDYKKVCNICGKIVGYPSQGEIEEALSGKKD